jgi:hypothetical protein
MSGVSSYNNNSLLPTFPLPLSAIAFDKPDEEITEAEKFANDGEWFKRMNRWVTLNFFNSNIQRFYTSDTSTLRWSDDMINNFAYYYGRQNNQTFSYTETINENDTIQAVYVPDQKIRQIIDPMIGSAIKMIAPIKDSISAKVLSADAIKGKEELKRKLEIKKQLQEMLSQVDGVQFAPGGVDQISEDEDIDDVMKKFKDEEELKLIRTAQGLYYGNDMAKKEEQSAFHTFVNNVSQFEVEVVNGKTTISFTPCYNTIVDTRATDDFLSDALVSGKVQFLSPAEIFSKWGNELTQEQKDHINRMSQKQYANWLECYNYYNTGFDNIIWWCQQTGKVSCTTTYWIGKKDLRYRRKETKYGGKKIQYLDDNTDYDITDENGKPLKDENGRHKTMKGSEIKGDASNYFVHQCTVIGNCYAVGYGYHPVQIRPAGQRQKPILPTIQFVHRLTMGYARSIASRLRHYSDEKGRLKLKIQELTGRDMGKVYALFADKMGLSDSETQEIFKDFKTMGFSLFNKSGEAGDESGRLTADVLDFSLQPSITAYIQLCRECDQEMESIASTSAIALGQQTSIVGKGVQENTIAQSSLGQLSLFDGLYEHWTKVLRYALNVEKTLKAGTEEMVQTSPNTAYLIKLNKKLRYEDIGLWIEPSDTLEGEQKKAMYDGLFSLAQNNGSIDATEALLNTLHLVRFNSTAEGINHLEKFLAKKKKEVAIQENIQQTAEMEREAMMIQMQQKFTVELQQMKELHSDYRTETTATMSALSKMHSDIEKSSAQILSALQAMQPVSPVENQVADDQRAQFQQQQASGQ